MKTIHTITLWAIGLFLLHQCSFADGIFKITNANNSYLHPIAISVRADVNDQIATTVTQQTFKNTGKTTLRLQYAFPLNANAVVTQCRFHQFGAWRTATVQGVPQDTVKGNSGGTPDNAFNTFIGATPFVMTLRDSLPPDSSITVELSYIELLRYGSGRVLYEYPLAARGISAPAVSFGFAFHLASQRELVSANSINHPLLTFTTTTHGADGGFEDKAMKPQNNLLVGYELSQKDLGATLLSTKPAGEDGYFTLLIEPDPQTQSELILKKVFTYIIDVSGSMMGTKLEQAKQAAIYCIQHLNPGDEFNVISFSDQALRYKTNPTVATPTNIEDAVLYIKRLSTLGGTNIQGALQNGLAQYASKDASNIIIFLTDGIATVDTKIVQQQNTANVRIFVFGVGSDVNKQLLTDIALGNNGMADFITETENTNQRITDFYNKIRNPLLQNIQLAFAPIEVYDVYPLQLPDIFVGEQLVISGRYKQPGAATASLKGKGVNAQETEYNYQVSFTGDSTLNAFVPKVWAKSRIDALLTLMTREGQQSSRWKEWRDEIIRLGLRYGILTPFTSFSDPGSNTGGTNGGGTGGTSSAEEEGTTVSETNSAAMFAPNPFSSTTAINIRVEQGTQHVLITIYDALGNVIAVLRDEELSSGEYRIEWSGTNSAGQKVAPGVYVCEIVIGNTIRRAMVVRE